MQPKEQALSNAAQHRRDEMLPILQNAMRDATRRKHNRRSIAVAAVLLLATIGLWQRTAETPTETLSSMQRLMASGNFERSTESSFPESWLQSRTLLVTPVTIETTELLQLCGENNMLAAVRCNTTKCSLHLGARGSSLHEIAAPNRVD